MTYLGIVPEKLLIRFNFPTLLTNDFERARMLEDGSTLTCLSKKMDKWFNQKKNTQPKTSHKNSQQKADSKCQIFLYL